jgi:hypothetical protein
MQTEHITGVHCLWTNKRKIISGKYLKIQRGGDAKNGVSAFFCIESEL